MAIEMVPQACPAAWPRGVPSLPDGVHLPDIQRLFWGAFRVQTALGALWLVCDRTPGRVAAAAYAARGSCCFHGLTPTAKCCRRLRGSNRTPGLAPGGLSFNSPVSRQCCGLGESGEAAVSPGRPRKRVLQAFLLERRSRGRMSPSGRFWRNSAEVAFSSEGGELLSAVA